MLFHSLMSDYLPEDVHPNDMHGEKGHWDWNFMDDAIEGFQGSVIELLYNRGGVLHYKSKALKVTVHHAVQAQRLDLLARLLNHRSQDHWARQDGQGETSSACWTAAAVL